MELTREKLEAVRFTTKGKWYLGEQVDDFIDEVIRASEKLSKAKEKLEKELDEKITEFNKLQDFKAEEKASKEISMAYQVMICEELIKERSRLIEEIKELQKEKQVLEEKEVTEEKEETK